MYPAFFSLFQPDGKGNDYLSFNGSTGRKSNIYRRG
jgi:hypothetical protein